MMHTNNGDVPVSMPAGSVFDIASESFELLVSGPEPLAVDGGLFEGLPRRLVSVDELARLLLARRYTAEVKDEVWSHLVSRSRTEAGPWTVACVGVALPGLIMCATKLAVWASDPADVHAAVMTGFLSGLATVELDRPWVLNRLMQAARREGQRTVREELSAPTPLEDGFESRQPPAPWGHPDLVLADLVTEGVITRDEADMIGTTRLEDVRARDYAAAHDLDYDTFLRARLRAEQRVRAWLKHTDRSTDTGFAVDAGVDTETGTVTVAPRTGTPGTGVVDRASERVVTRLAEVTGHSPEWVRAALRVAAARAIASRPAPPGAPRPAVRRPRDGRPSTRSREQRASRTVSNASRDGSEHS